MALTFVLGNSKKNHLQQIMDNFIADYKNNPHDKFFFVVPNHIKFESEIEIIKQFKEKIKPNSEIIATNNLQIFSLSRLAWYFLRDEEVLNRQTLTSTKKSMIVRNILNNRKKELQIFKGEIQNNGFIDEVVSQIEELQNGQIDSDDLDNIISNLNATFEIKKTKELKLIYDDYNSNINENYLHNNLLVEKLLEVFKSEDLLSKTHFYFLGFSTFKNIEFELLNTISQDSNLTISLELDKPYIELPESTDFYYRPARTYSLLYSAARDKKVVINNNYANLNRVSNDIGLLEDFWISSNSVNKSLNSAVLETKNSIQIWECTDRQTEIQAISTYIRQLVATQNYRYKDFLILSRDLSSYESFIKPIFDTNEVPMFFDLQKDMSKHPLKLLIDYLFAFAQGNLNHESIFQLLKLNLLLPSEDISEEYFSSAIDLAENYSLAQGLYKSDWLSQEDFTLVIDLSSVNDEILRNKYQENINKINSIKHYVANIYQNINEVFDSVTTNRQLIIELYKFLEDNLVFFTLRNWQNNDLEKGDLLNSSKPEQVVNVLNQLLSEFIEIFGDDTFDAKNFLDVLDSGFSQSQYSQIPSTLDAVNISELGMVQMNNRKITFILGSTSDQMPKSNKNNSLISDEEKMEFSKYLKPNSEFSDTAEIINNDEPFLHNSAFTSAEQRIIFSYPLIGDSDQEQISPYVQRIKDYFGITPRVITNTPKADDDYALEYVGSIDSTLNYLIRLNRSLKDRSIKMSNNWNTIQSLLLADTSLKNKVQGSLNYQNTVTNLDPEVAQSLYGDTLNVSISQLETFYSNEFEYFLTYGLKLKKRDIFELNQANMGSFFHDNLDYFVKYLNDKDINLAQLSMEQTKEVSKKIIKELLESKTYKIFSSSPQMKYIASNLSDILSGLMISINQQSNLLNFQPINSEIVFGTIANNKGIEGLNYILDDGKKIFVRGKIDRIDKFKNSDSIQIIDYKSSKKEFKYNMFSAGLQLQIPTYIQVVMNDQSQLGVKSVLGAFYSRIYSPINDAEYIVKDNYKNRQLTGIIVNDGNNIDQLLTNGVDSKNSSDIYKLALKKNGELSAQTNDSVTKEQLELMLNYNKSLIIQAAQRIFSGEIKLNPYRVNDNDTGFKFTNYKSIFEFDAMLPENSYNDISNISKKQFLDQLSNGGEYNVD
ncbi:ATP-dependent helicase/deoxyribonuclease subunit B [Companilactobacillus sp. RD055328]|uniref:PD-(D/E)XK nuclease family protein n=1 Tax=Companilactobacillus sp. RD055328 TaxID=2916634 RepID=UPI001FC7F603|nr:PD-(D/E)XK nuclease family protein [Companilactobacillus sp. RD055328]GKQ42679.1 ATP-dependent helicase/deoxyribonuclease subunit B [Companilactobacillus sp. RD055328]